MNTDKKRVLGFRTAPVCGGGFRRRLQQNEVLCWLPWNQSGILHGQPGSPTAAILTPSLPRQWRRGPVRGAPFFKIKIFRFLGSAWDCSCVRMIQTPLVSTALTCRKKRIQKLRIAFAFYAFSTFLEVKICVHPCPSVVRFSSLSVCFAYFAVSIFPKNFRFKPGGGCV